MIIIIITVIIIKKLLSSINHNDIIIQFMYSVFQAWVRKDDQLIQGFVSSFRPKRKSVEDLMNEEDRLLLEAAAARQLALENAAEIWQEHFLDDGTVNIIYFKI